MDKRKQALIFIQKSDVKAASWARELTAADGAKLVPIKGSPIMAPFELIRALLAGERVGGFVFRYLNDYPSFWRTLIRTISELLTYFIVKFVHRGRVVWICHNVDRESEANFPKITRFRRAFFSKKSSRVFVTSDLLIPYAERYLNVPLERLRVASFGRPCLADDGAQENERVADVRRWALEARSGGARVGLWVGSPAEKSAAGLRSFLRFVEAENRRGGSHCGFVIGAGEEWIRGVIGDALFQRMSENDWVRVVGSLDFPWSEWCAFDYIWKPCDDVSLTMTALNAAVAGVPMVAHSGSFIGEFLEYYGLGVSVDPVNPVINDQVFSRCNAPRYEELWRRQSWRNGAIALIEPFSEKRVS